MKGTQEPAANLHPALRLRGFQLSCRNLPESNCGRVFICLTELRHFADSNALHRDQKFAGTNFRADPSRARVSNRKKSNREVSLVMRYRTLVVLYSISLAALLLTGCSATTASNPQTAPQTVVQPANQAVTAGHSASFSVTATGTPSLSYQWNKNGTAVSGATSSTYTTPPTTSADNGATFDVVVSNAKGSVTSATATLTVTSASAVTITTTSLPNGTVQTAYSATLQATGGTAPYTWSVGSGSLPAALTLSPSGTISGTPTTAGSSAFTIQVADSAGNKASTGFSITINSSSGGTMPAFGHVFIVLGENDGSSGTYNSRTMPYLTSLANKYGLSTKYWADTHPSIGNYEALTAGQIFTNTDSDTPSSLPLSSDNIAAEVEKAGKTWKDYVETGGSGASVQGCSALNNGTYYVRHDPLQYFTNINKANIVCFSQFATDLANNALPNLSWLSPNGCDDAHDCSIGTFDKWLQTELGPLLASSYFQAGGDGLLIITFDEGSGSPDCSTTTVGQGCGGQVETVMISAVSKMGYQSVAGDPANYNNTYDEASILRTIADALGVKTSGLGGASTRVPMADFFQ